MKKLLPVIFCLALFAGCASPQPENSAAPGDGTAKKEGKLLKVALFTDNGSRGTGPFHLARILATSPQVSLTLVESSDVRAGKLAEVDLLLVPGGSSQLQCEGLGEEGKEEVRKFVRNGGAYVGVCAGFHCTLNRKERIALMPFEYREGAGGAGGPVLVDFSKRGAEVLGIAPGRRRVKYSKGPICKPGAPWEHGKAEVLAVYKTTISPIGRPGGDFLNAPAVIFGNYGKGKVIATSFHPEADTFNEDILVGCIAAVTGVRLTPISSRKVFHPYQAGYFFRPAVGKGCTRAIREYLSLLHNPRLRVLLASGFSNDQFDVIILPQGGEKSYASFKDGPRGKALLKFLDRGGIVLASGSAMQYMPKRPGIIDMRFRSDSLTDAAVLFAEEKEVRK